MTTHEDEAPELGAGTPALRELLRPEIHVWIARPAEIRDTRLLTAYQDLLTEDERARGQRFRFERHRQRYWVTRALVRTCLSRYVAVAPQRWRFEPTEHGRPEIAAPAAPSGLSFNLSHTDELIACAVAYGSVVGCDVEDLERRVEADGIAQRFFAATEWRSLERSPQALRKRRFLELWTLKEAYLKACGTGLRTPLEAFAFELSERESEASEALPTRISITFDGVDDRADRWWFTLLCVDHRHLLALAVRTPAPVPIRVRECVPLLPGG